MRRVLHWAWDAFLEALVGAIAMGLVETVAWILRKAWKRRRKRNKRNEEDADGKAEPD
jgi:hypothetical protein